MRVLKSTLGFSLLGLMLVGPVQAQTVGGNINASLVLTSSCLINGVAGADGATFGALNFGTTTSLFSTATGQVLSGGSALRILCSAGTTPKLTLGAGAHDGERMKAPGPWRAPAISWAMTCTATPGMQTCWESVTRLISSSVTVPRRRSISTVKPLARPDCQPGVTATPSQLC